MSWCTPDEVKKGMRSLMKLSESAPLPGYWHEIIERCTGKGKDDVLSGLLERSYTITQIENWDRLWDYHFDQARYWCLIEGAAFHDYPLDYADRFDHRGKLGKIVLATDQVHTEPNRGVSKLIQSGRMTERPVAGPRCGEDADRWHMDDQY